jgi:hypothetical protein
MCLRKRSARPPDQIPTRSQPDPNQIPTRSQPDPDQIPTRSQPDPDQIPTRSRPDPDQIPTRSRPDPDQIPTRSRPDSDQTPTRSESYFLAASSLIASLFTAPYPSQPIGIPFAPISSPLNPSLSRPSGQRLAARALPEIGPKRRGERWACGSAQGEAQHG